MAGLVLLLGAGPRPAAAQALPPTWVADRTAAGSLYVPHPPGWVVQERNAGAFIVFRSGNGPVAEALVYVRPQRFGAGRNAVDVLGLLPREEADLFPGARVLRGDAVPPPRTGVQGEFTFTLQGRAFRGVAVVLHTGATGALYVMSASAAAWPQQALTMAQILSAFRYLSPEGAAGASPAAAVSAMQPWRDPNEGAFTLPVPRGWQVRGGMMRPNPIEYRPEVVLVSPDGGIQLRLGDGTLELFAVPYELPGGYALPPGTRPSSFGGSFSPYLPGARFLTDIYLPRRFGGARLLHVQALPELAAHSYRLTFLPPGVQGRADAGEVFFEAPPYRGWFSAVTFLYAAGGGLTGGQSWEVKDLIGCLALPGQEATARAVLAAMVRGFRMDPNWQMRQLQMDGHKAALVNQYNAQLGEIFSQTIAQRSIGQERAQAPLVGAARGEIEVTNAQTGQRMRVPLAGASQDYYQANNTGEVFTAGQPLPPFDFTQLVIGQPR